MKKILVVFTGGTIGSAAENGTIKPNNSAPFKLLQLFEQQYPDHASIHIDTLQPLQILSENLVPAAWKLIINAIESANPENYDGIIVTHGTDTLAYSSAALGLYFHALPKPLLLVSSDYPLDNPRGNGMVNFICAVEFIRKEIAVGVFVPYRNAGQTMQIHHGLHLTCSLQLSGDFFSVKNKSFMQFDGQNFISGDILQDIKKPKKHNLARISSRQDFSLSPDFSSRILMIKPYPGLDYSHFNLNNIVAVLHDLYHSGTACTTEQWGENHSLIEFLKRCQEKNIPVYLAPAFKTENAYQSTRELIAYGADMIWNLSIESAYVKLMLAYGNFIDSELRTAFIHNSLAGEELSNLVDNA